MSTSSIAHTTGRLLLAAVFMLAWGPAAAQWQWVDRAGQRVFSDTPPPPDIPERQILRRPAGVPAPAPETTAPAAPAAAQPAPPAASRDPALENRLRQAQAQEEAKKKVEEAQAAKARAEACEQARQAKASLDSGVRLSRVNARGEREFLDEAARAQEMQNAQRGIAQNCN